VPAAKARSVSTRLRFAYAAPSHPQISLGSAKTKPNKQTNS
jgi:hypothetical protein